MSVRFGNKKLLVVFCPDHGDLWKQKSQRKLGPEEGKGDAGKGAEERGLFYTLFLGSIKVHFHNLCEYTPIKQCQFTWTNNLGRWSLHCLSPLGSPERGGKDLVSSGPGWMYSCLPWGSSSHRYPAGTLCAFWRFFIKRGFTRRQSSDWMVFKRGGTSLGLRLLTGVRVYLLTPV